MKKFFINVPSLAHILAVVILDKRSVYYNASAKNSNLILVYRTTEEILLRSV